MRHIQTLCLAAMNIIAPIPALQKRIKKLEEGVLRLRQQGDAANAQLAFVLETLNGEKAPFGAFSFSLSLRNRLRSTYFQMLHIL